MFATSAFSSFDTERRFRFFEKSSAPLGILVRERQRRWGSIVMSSDEWPPFLWIGPDGGNYYGTDVKISDRRPMHLAFKALPLTAETALTALSSSTRTAIASKRFIARRTGVHACF